MPELKIVLNNTGAYVPGGSISGHVVVNSKSSFKARGVKVALFGDALTEWTEHRTNSDYTVRSNIVYANFQSILLQPPDQKMQGSYNLPFTFPIPLNIPPSFAGGYGSIRYLLKAKIDQPWKIDTTTMLQFPVTPVLDLNRIQGAVQPVMGVKNGSVGCCSSAKIGMKVTMNKSGICCGENVPIQVEVTRKGKALIKYVEFDLRQVGSYRAEGKYRMSNVPIGTKRILVKDTGANPFYLTEQYTVPGCPITFNADIIQVNYVLVIRMETSAWCSSTLACELPVVVGNVAVQGAAPLPPPPRPPPPTAPTPSVPTSSEPADKKSIGFEAWNG